MMERYNSWEEYRNYKRQLNLSLRRASSLPPKEARPQMYSTTEMFADCIAAAFILIFAFLVNFGNDYCSITILDLELKIWNDNIMIRNMAFVIVFVAWLIDVLILSKHLSERTMMTVIDVLKTQTMIFIWIASPKFMIDQLLQPPKLLIIIIVEYICVKMDVIQIIEEMSPVLNQEYSNYQIFKLLLSYFILLMASYYTIFYVFFGKMFIKFVQLQWNVSSKLAKMEHYGQVFCPICLNDLTKHQLEIVIMLECNHIIHKHCLIASGSVCCPLCRFRSGPFRMWNLSFLKRFQNECELARVNGTNYVWQQYKLFVLFMDSTLASVNISGWRK